MISVPATLKTEIQKLRGRRLRGRVRIDYTDINRDNTIRSTASSVNPGTRVSQVFNGREDMTAKWLSLDGSWLLGQYALAPVTDSEFNRYEIGWWPFERTNANGEYPVVDGLLYGETLYGEQLYGELLQPVSCTIVLLPRTFTQVRVSFDNQRMEFGVNFDVEFYRGTDLIYTESVTNSSGLKYVADITPVTEIDKLRLVIHKWSEPYRQAKVAEFFTSVSELYEGSDLFEIRVNESRSTIGYANNTGETLSAQCVVRLYNRDRKFDFDNTNSTLYNLIRNNVRIVPEIGDGTDWIPLGEFFARAWDIPRQDLRVTVTGFDRIALLEDGEYRVSQIITAPDDEQFVIDTNAEWLGGTGINTLVSGDTIRIAYE